MGRGRTAVTLFAMVSATAAMAYLVLANAGLALELADARRLKATPAMAAGTLAGWSSHGPSELHPKDFGNLGVLFGVAVKAGSGDIEYWRAVAEHVRATAPSAQLVGLCRFETTCADHRNLPSGLTVLEFMDPVFVHTLTQAAVEGRALLFRGSRVLGSIVLLADAEDFAKLIAIQAKQWGREGL
jgi:hypothetical protein